MPDPHLTPAEELERSDLVLWLLHQLKPRERRLVKWHYLDGMPLKKIGRRLHLSEGRVSTLISEITGKLGE